MIGFFDDKKECYAVTFFEVLKAFKIRSYVLENKHDVVALI